MRRQYDLDWIRVLATIAVFIYHCFMFFNPWAWHVKNNEIDPSYITAISLFISTWLMPVFFAVSGINSYYALQKRNGKEFVKERIARLGIPLLFGVMILSPPQVYIERVSHGQFSGSFFTWFPHYFEGVYLDIGGTGNFAFVGLHLWYLLVLLLFTFITLPIFLKRKPKIVKDVSPLFLILLTFPLMLVSIWMDLVNLAGWDITFYFVIFLYGYFIFTKASFKPTINKMFPVTITISVLTSVVFVYGFLSDVPSAGGIYSVLFSSVKALNCWSCLLVIFALGERHLSFSNRWLSYSNRASMPFYVLHQPVIVILGFFISDIGWSIPLKLIFLSVVSFTIIMILFHFGISKVSFIRILFGMKGDFGPTINEKPNKGTTKKVGF
jgi:glucans biosynthesis protein C